MIVLSFLLTGTRVSIPFKRESVSKACMDPRRDQNLSKVSIPFKRESVSKDGKHITVGRKRLVSIPFKRESVSKGQPVYQPGASKMFQFPSNGKAYPKCFLLSR